MTDVYGAQVRAQLAEAQAELAALHAGEEPYEDERAFPTPSQWIWWWNRATPEERLSVAADRVKLLEGFNRCVTGMHEQRLAERWGDLMAQKVRAEQAEARIAAVRALATRLAEHGSPWDGNEPAVAEELLAILDGPTGCTCSLLNGCDCGMPIHSEVVRGGRRIPKRPS